MSGPRSPVIRVFDCHVVRERDGDLEFLLLLRSSKKIYGGTWRMVGGKLEGEETAWGACLRELGEETGLRPRRLLTVPYVNRFYEWKHDRINDIPVFVAVVADGQDPTLDDEHRDFAWLPLEAAAQRLPWPAQREGMRAARALLLEGNELQPFMEIPLDS